MGGVLYIGESSNAEEHKRFRAICTLAGVFYSGENSKCPLSYMHLGGRFYNGESSKFKVPKTDFEQDMHLGRRFLYRGKGKPTHALLFWLCFRSAGCLMGSTYSSRCVAWQAFCIAGKGEAKAIGFFFCGCCCRTGTPSPEAAVKVSPHNRSPQNGSLSFGSTGC